MTTHDIFRRVTAALDGAGIPYMLTGSFASSFHGSPRSTQDIDIVIAPTADQLRGLAKMFPESEYYLDIGAALEALAMQSQFNIIDLVTGWKIDLIIRRDRPFSQEEFARRREVRIADVRLSIATAEDVLIAKLEWSKLGESSRQIEDAAGILRIRGGELDLGYIEVWVERLGLGSQWEAAQRWGDH
ncbi:MAG: hypothetical protein Q7W56_01195 [Candidatus Latescibacteria bacterium]|nr:hypothetical protein [Candidatus Latescibacterota bacterium]